MNFIVITVLIQNFLIHSTHTQQLFFDFMPVSEEEQDVNDDDDYSMFEEVLEDPFYEYRFCTNHYQHEKLIEDLAWIYLVDIATYEIDFDKLLDDEFDALVEIIHKFLEPTSSYINEVEVHYRRINFYDINVWNNVTNTELENIIETYYLKNELPSDEIEDSY